MAKKSAIEKRDTAPAPVVEVLRVAKGANYPPGRMLIASPLTIQAHVAKIPKGKVMTTYALRAELAIAHDADYTCPLTTGIFLRIVAEAAQEDQSSGKRNSTPYWRVVKEDGSLLDKLPGGVAAQQQLLKQEGHSFTSHKVPRLENLERKSVR